MYKLLPVILCMVWLGGFSQVKTIGTPNILNYPKSVYKAGTQNWDIAQDADGFMYFANNDGVLRFDGTNWELIPVSIETPVRSVHVDSKNRMFIGLPHDFGQLVKDESGVYKFESLKHLIPERYKNFSDVWRIHEVKQGIVFQAYEHAFVYNEGEMKVISPKKKFLFSFNVNGRLFIQEPGVGLFEYFNWSIEEIPWAGELKDKEIWTILRFGDNQLLLGTAGFGFYKYSNGVLSKWNTPASEFIQKNKLYSAARLGSNYFAFGSILGGVIICDSEGQIIQKINREKGLLNSTILSVFPDKDGNLWLGLDNGIDYLEINSPLSFFTIEDGIGTGYCCTVHNGYLYLGTNQGLFARAFNPSGQNNFAPFELVKNTEGQVWSLKAYAGQLLCGHNMGTFIVENKEARKISNELGAWKYIPLKKYPNYLLGGHYNGLVLLKKGEEGWEFKWKIKGFDESSRFITEDESGSIWISHGAKGVYRVTLNDNLDSARQVKLYTKENGLPLNEDNILLEIGARWYVSSDRGLYEYRESDDVFVRADEVNSVFNCSKRIKFIGADNRNDLWFIAENEAGLIHRNEDFTSTKFTAPFKQLNGKFVNEFEFLYPYSYDNIFIGLEDGFAHYSSRFTKTYTNSYPAYITKVQIPYLDSVINVIHPNGHKHVFPFKRNALRFYYTAPFYENPKNLQFSYFIENYSTDWSPWSYDTYRDLTNLPESDYVFKVKAKNSYGVESEIDSFEFTITPPWYRSKLSKYAYVIVLVLLVWLIIWLVQKRLDKSKEKERVLLQNEIRKKEEQMQKQALMTDKEIIRLKNEQLESEKIFLDKELANQTMSIIQKNKFLLKLKQELKRIQDETSDGSVQNKMLILKKRIDKEIDSDKQNKVFESYFDEVHNDFFKRLKEKYPQLSPKELRLCAYIRMNISTKEIATLLNISDRGVEISRYRLRKKINLSRDVHLSTFLSNI